MSDAETCGNCQHWYSGELLGGNGFDSGACRAIVQMKERKNAYRHVICTKKRPAMTKGGGNGSSDLGWSCLLTHKDFGCRSFTPAKGKQQTL